MTHLDDAVAADIQHIVTVLDRTCKDASTLDALEVDVRNAVLMLAATHEASLSEQARAAVRHLIFDLGIMLPPTREEQDAAHYTLLAAHFFPERPSASTAA